MGKHIVRWSPSRTIAGALTWVRDRVASSRKLALAAGLACTLAAASTAFASTSGLFYSDFHLKGVQDAGDNGTGVTPGSVNCPSSHPTATGGGAEIRGDQSGLDLELKSSAPSPGSSVDSWDVEANNSSGSPASMDFDAICAKGKFRTPFATDPSVQPGTESFRTATCPAGTKLAGGGVFSDGGDHATEIGDSAPAGTGAHPNAWTGTINNGSSQEIAMGVVAVCATQGHYHVERSLRLPVDNNSQAGASVKCPAGTHVSGGGVHITGLDDALEVASSAPFDAGNDPNVTPDDGWHGVANNDGSGGTVLMQTDAVCKG